MVVEVKLCRNLGKSLLIRDFLLTKKMMKNSKNENRRDFFKHVAKAVLPILGTILLADVPQIINASERNSMGCKYGCINSCMETCNSTCSESCRYRCKISCGVGCDGCTTTCIGGCKVSCTDTCKSSSK